MRSTPVTTQGTLTVEERKRIRVLLAGPDTLYFSCDAAISDAVRLKLDEEKAKAQVAATQRTTHCPEWPGARVCP